MGAMSDIYLGDLCREHGLTEQETADCLEKLIGPGGAWESLITERHVDHIVLRAVSQVEMLELLANWHPAAGGAA
jgi:hypothetical protein